MVFFAMRLLFAGLFCIVSCKNVVFFICLVELLNLQVYIPNLYW